MIELLVVVVVIGTLAAIALPNFVGQRSKAQDSEAKSAVRNAVSLVESCLTDAALATSCGLTDAAVAAMINSAAPGATADVTGAEAYVLTAMSRSGNSFTIRKVAGAISRSCTADGTPTGGCPGTTW